MSGAIHERTADLTLTGQPERQAEPTERPGFRLPIRYGVALKLLRRVHLFAGLFMTPWVFLYGVTGFLFNHPDAFPDREVRNTARSAIAGTSLERFPTAPELAERVVEGLNAKDGSHSYSLIDRESSAYSRPLYVTATGRGREHSVRFDPESGEAFIRSTAAKKPGDKDWPGGKKLVLPDAPRDRLAQGVPQLLTKLGIETDTTSVKNPPDLICTIDEHGKPWRIAYNIQTGAITALPTSADGRELSTRRFLTGLHLAFTYPSRLDARWLWAIVVDLMFVSMVFWGSSGLLMWWQTKRLRFWGFATLAASAIIAVLLALGMHEVLASRI